MFVQFFLFRHTLMLIKGKRPEKMDQENSNLMPFLLSLTTLVRNISEKIRSSVFKNNLKLICVTQFLKKSSKGSYDIDDRQSYQVFLI